MRQTEGLAEARRALRGPSRAALRRRIEVLLDDGFVLGPCRLRRAKLKPGRKLSAYFDVAVADASGAAATTRAVAIEWGPDARAPEDSAVLEGEAISRGVAAPFARLRADAREEMHVLVSPLDARFPQLVRLADPAHALSVLPGASGPVRVATIRYRPRQRHVLRYDHPGGASVAFAKLYADDDDGRRAAGVATAISGALSGRYGLAAVRPLAYLAGERALVMPPAAGAPLTRSLRRGAREGHLRRAGELLTRLHRACLVDGLDVPVRDLEDELRATTRACEHIASLLPEAGRAAASTLGRARETYAGAPPGEATLVHGDFKLDHLWAADAGLTVIDFDSARVADPALDVGKLLADLRWWCDGRAVAADGMREAFLAGYGAPRGSPLLRRARAWEAVWLVKAAARRVSILDPAWETHVRRILERASGLLAR